MPLTHSQLHSPSIPSIYKYWTRFYAMSAAQHSSVSGCLRLSVSVASSNRRAPNIPSGFYCRQQTQTHLTYDARMDIRRREIGAKYVFNSISLWKRICNSSWCLCLPSVCVWVHRSFSHESTSFCLSYFHTTERSPSSSSSCANDDRNSVASNGYLMRYSNSLSVSADGHRIKIVDVRMDWPQTTHTHMHYNNNNVIPSHSHRFTSQSARQSDC